MGDRLAGEARVLELERELASCRAHAEALQISADQAAEVRPWRGGQRGGSMGLVLCLGWGTTP